MHRIATFVLGLLLAGVTDASALVLCYRGKTVAARDTCRRKEKLLSLAGVGLPGAPGERGATGTAGPPLVHLVDATGADVGPVLYASFDLPLSYDYSNPVMLALLQHPPFNDGVVLGIDVAGNPTGVVRYQSNDCTGTPLIARPDLLPAVQVVVDTAFYPSQSPVTTTAVSMETSDQSRGCESTTPRAGCCRAVASSGIELVAAATATLTELGIKRPLRAVGAP